MHVAGIIVVVRRSACPSFAFDSARQVNHRMSIACATWCERVHYVHTHTHSRLHSVQRAIANWNWHLNAFARGIYAYVLYVSNNIHTLCILMGFYQLHATQSGSLGIGTIVEAENHERAVLWCDVLYFQQLCQLPTASGLLQLHLRPSPTPQTYSDHSADMAIIVAHVFSARVRSRSAAGQKSIANRQLCIKAEKKCIADGMTS